MYDNKVKEKLQEYKNLKSELVAYKQSLLDKINQINLQIINIDRQIYLINHSENQDINSKKDSPKKKTKKL